MTSREFNILLSKLFLLDDEYNDFSVWTGLMMVATVLGLAIGLPVTISATDDGGLGIPPAIAIPLCVLGPCVLLHVIRIAFLILAAVNRAIIKLRGPSVDKYKYR